MAVQHELGQLRQQMRALNLPNGSKTQTAALKEIMRQLELRLAAQLQEKIALENRIAGLTPWAMGLLALVLIPLFPNKAPEALHPIRVVVIISAALAVLSILIASSDAIRGTRSWCYAGSDMQSTGASEDNILRVTISHQTEGVQSNKSVLRALQNTYLAPFIPILVGALVVLLLLVQGKPG